MARTILTAQQISLAGLKPTLAGVTADGDEAPFQDRVFLFVDNQNASTLTVTVQTPATSSGLTVADRTFSLLTTEQAMIPLFYEEYRQSGDVVYIDYDIQTSVSSALIRL